MGDLQVCGFPTENGHLHHHNHNHNDHDHHHRLLGSGLDPVSPSSSLKPDPGSIAEENWERAEEVTTEIVNKIHPTVESNFKRKQVVEYVQTLIRRSLAFEVLPYGSVPLKTYLPDGDIDLTAISSPAIEEALVSDVYTVLRGEELNEDAQFEVKDVHCIDAEVKLIKCIVQNTVVDISFNQLGGLCTLCFLEEADQLVGKNHLFKRSIILIKAWCYYESRILGAHHGLISTYALETLILYIFHLFHSSLNGPLAVLYKFLDYFSKFDWENYCISLNGPVCKSSLPNIVAKPPENVCGELLLSDEFLKACVDRFYVPSRKPEMDTRPFPQKHLSIVDPLKENNNLGRSVNRGNFFRIRSAFKYGARKLGRILLLPREKIADELKTFFANTLGSDYWSDVQDSELASVARSSDNSVSLSSHSDTCSEDDTRLTSTGGYDNDTLFSEKCDHTQVHHPVLSGENGRIKTGISCREMLINSGTEDEISCTVGAEPIQNHFLNSTPVCSCTKGIVPSASTTPNSAGSVSENLSPTLGGKYFAGIRRNSQPLKSLLDLRGDHNDHLKSLEHSQLCHMHAVSAPIPPCPSMSPKSENKNSWETVRQSPLLKHNRHSQINMNHFYGTQFYCVNPVAPFRAATNSEEQKKRRGTGTYIPNMSYHSNRGDRLYSGKGRTQALANHGQSFKQTHGNDMPATLQENNLSEHGHDLSEVEYPLLSNGKPTPPEAHHSYPSVWGSSNASGSSRAPVRTDCGSHGLQHPERLPSTSDLGTSDSGASATGSVASVVEDPDSILETEQERALLQQYHLKDDVDFPPLSLKDL
uniref:PAP-associated domain-containing protein n=2 Tax=Salix viminalis TaxID=40686 RepID=A0A6N2M229_SALVM